VFNISITCLKCANKSLSSVPLLSLFLLD
jgi:hypothetical protein